MYLKGNDNEENKRERERESYLVPAGALCIWLQQPELRKSETRNQELHQASHVVEQAVPVALLCCLAKARAGSGNAEQLGRKWSLDAWTCYTGLSRLDLSGLVSAGNPAGEETPSEK